MRSFTFALIALSFPACAAAQHRGGMPMGAPAVGHAGPVVMHAAPAAPHAVLAPHAAVPGSPHNNVRIQGAPSNTIKAAAFPRTRGTGIRTTHPINNFRSDFDEFDFQDVPGLGFDFPHLAAVNGNRHHHRGRFVGGAPFFDGFLLTSPSVIVEQPAPAEAQPAPDDTVADNVEESEPVHRPRRTHEAAASTAPAAEPAPQRDVEQYVFVRRDGGLLFAVAYSWENGTLRYITPDGLRRSIGRDALDLNATEQFNEQRGVNFHAPA